MFNITNGHIKCCVSFSHKMFSVTTWSLCPIAESHYMHYITLLDTSSTTASQINSQLFHLSLRLPLFHRSMFNRTEQMAASVNQACLGHLALRIEVREVPILNLSLLLFQCPSLAFFCPPLPQSTDRSCVSALCRTSCL